MKQVTERLGQGSSYAGIGMVLIPLISSLPLSPEMQEIATNAALALGGLIAVLVNR